MLRSLASPDFTYCGAINYVDILRTAADIEELLPPNVFLNIIDE
jgi:hypothetical protein